MVQTVWKPSSSLILIEDNRRKIHAASNPSFRIRALSSPLEEEALGRTCHYIAKLMKVAPVLEASARLGYPASLVVGIGSLLLACVAVYAIPRTSILGVILLTGYLGGAIAANVRVSDPLFETCFPAIFGVLTWAGIFLRDDRLRTLIPLRR